jgi:hypothetical protein
MNALVVNMGLAQKERQVGSGTGSAQIGKIPARDLFSATGAMTPDFKSASRLQIIADVKLLI